MLRTGFGLFSDILPGSVADMIGANPPYVRTFQGGSAGHGGRDGHCAGSAEQRSRCNRGRQPDLRPGFEAGMALLRVSASESCELSSAGSHYCGTRRQASRPVLHGVESWHRTSVRKQRKPSRAIRGHAGSEPAVPDPSKRLPDGVPGLLCAVPLPAAHGPKIRGGHPVLNRREQSLQWSSTDRHEAPRARSAGAGELHLEPLHGHGLQRRIPAVLRRSDPFAFARRIWRATMARATTTSGTISTHSMYINCRSKCRITGLGYALNGWQVSGTAFWHSGIPFSVLVRPIRRMETALCKARTAICEPRSRVSLYEHNPSRCHAARHSSVA